MRRVVEGGARSMEGGEWLGLWSAPARVPGATPPATRAADPSRAPDPNSTNTMPTAPMNERSLQKTEE